MMNWGRAGLYQIPVVEGQTAKPQRMVLGGGGWGDGISGVGVLADTTNGTCFG